MPTVHLPKKFGLLNAISINMSNMVGTGPFITVPAILATMGGPQALVCWFIGAVIAIADGLVFVRAQIEDHPGWFIVDNATQGFTVDRAFARRNSLHSSGQAPARGGGPNTIDAGIIRDVRIGLPGLELTHRNLTMIDLQPIEPALATKSTALSAPGSSMTLL